jgi:S-adenosylmethionine hydrolase
MLRPVITFLTDFGPDSAAAICRGVMLGISRDAQIVDITHSVRKFAIRDGAWLLWVSVPHMPVGFHIAVVDPGVGTARRPIAIRSGRGDIFVGPDNGLLVPAAERLEGIAEVRALENRSLMLPRTTNTFHGRDVFAPVAAHLANGVAFEKVGSTVDAETIVRLTFPVPSIGTGILDTTIIYVDSFGNLRLAGEPGDLEAALGALDSGQRLAVEFAPENGRPAIHESVTWQRTFGEVEEGRPLLYEDSFGRLALADNQGSISRRLGLDQDRPVRIRPA